MCAICDANVVHEIFNPKKQTLSGKIFLNWINPKRHLVFGGKLKRELLNHNAFKEWVPEAILGVVD